MKITDKIYVAGHNGLVGSEVVRLLQSEGYINILTRSHEDLDLLDQKSVKQFFEETKPDYVIDCAAKVGGIKDNIDHPAIFLYDNLQIQNNIIWSAKEIGVKKLLFVASSTVYPADSQQPVKEDYLMTGPVEKSNGGYAYAKIAGIKLCEYINEEFGMAFISCTPTNLYGEGSSFEPNTAHVIPSLIDRMHTAKVDNLQEVSIWGTGQSKREFLYVKDLAKSILWLMNNYEDKQLLNIGTGQDISIKDLAIKIKALVGYEGELFFDTTKPNGAPRRQLDVSRIHNLGWHHEIDIDEGLKNTYNWYLSNIVK